MPMHSGVPLDYSTYSVGVALPVVPSFTDNGNGTATIGPTIVHIRSTSDYTGNVYTLNVPQNTLTFTNNGSEYVVVDYNNGSPIYKAESNYMLINGSNMFVVFKCWRVGTVIHSLDADSAGIGLSNKIDTMLVSTMPYRRAASTGLIILESVTPNPRTITVTSSYVYAGSHGIFVASYNSGVDRFTKATVTNGVWSYDASSLVYDNENENPITGPVACHANKYMCRWFYRSIGDIKEVFYVLGPTHYNNPLEASNESERTDLPKVIKEHCVLIGRAIIKYQATSGITQSAFGITFSGANTIAHNDTSGLQGGDLSTNQYYHLTQTQNAAFDTVGNLITPKTSGYGLKVDTASPTFGWRDMLCFVRPRSTGGAAPALSAFIGNVTRYAYSIGDDGEGEFHIPHDYVPGSDLFLHMHWSHNGTAISGSFTVDFNITYAKGHNQANFSAEITPQITYNTVNIATTPRYRHRIEEIQLSAASPTATQLNTSLIEVDGLIMFHYDVSVIPTITGGSPNAPYLFFIDLHYQSTSCATKAKVPNFYI